ncbi:Glycosyl hydrolase family 31 protein [Aphelenchoides besseyi]|nr:Glycosyl hydrolase family 31 protein [Aphelenchoides besseyi]
MRRLVLCLSLLLFGCIDAADRSKFKTCDQTGFCKRHREGVERPEYHVLAETVKSNETALLARLKSSENELEIAIIVLRESTFRIVVDESGKRLRDRFIPYQSLDGYPVQVKPFKDFEIGAESASFEPIKNRRVVVNYNPFWVKVFDDDELLIAVNSAGLFKFEHFREKPADAKNEDGFWEETFSGHTDTKPYGSSSVGIDVEFFGFKYLYGLPEHATTFALTSTKPNNMDPYRIYNVDIFEYEMKSGMALYGGSAFVVAHNKRHTVGALWLNAADTWVDIHSTALDRGVIGKLVDKFGVSGDAPHAGAHFFSEAGVADLFIFLGPRPNDVFRQQSVLTGRHPLPPLMGISYHQCRWNYNDEQDVAEVHAKMDEYDIPFDSIWLDIEHTNGKRYFTWDADKFPNPKAMAEKLEAQGRHIVTIIDPHVKKDESYDLYRLAKERGYFVKNADGTSDFVGDCWPGQSSYLDVLHPEVQKYLAEHYRLDKYEGSTERMFTWNDMNEPSVFGSWEMTVPRDVRHSGGWENREVHNIYGQCYHNATYLGHLLRSDYKLRPFILTRSFFTGSQRTTAIWTGDNAAQWDHLRATVPMVLALSIAGFPNIGADVGGFFGNPDEELLVRWYQTGAYQPFFRAHAHIDAKRREPYLFGEETRNAIRQAIIERYQLLPYWYTLFYEHTLTGQPVIRPVWSEFDEDESAMDEEREYMLGKALLIRPVMEPEVKEVSLYLPGHQRSWFDWRTGKMHVSPGAVYTDTPLNKIPVYQRGGTIVPIRRRHRRSSKLMRNDPITLVIACELNRDFANGSLYLDDGESFAYQTDNDYMYWGYTFKKESNNLHSITSKNLDKKGKFDPDVWIDQIVVRGVRFYPQNVHIYIDDYTPEDLEFTHDRESRQMIIRKPGGYVAREWRIDIHS